MVFKASKSAQASRRYARVEVVFAKSVHHGMLEGPYDTEYCPASVAPHCLYGGILM